LALPAKSSRMVSIEMDILVDPARFRELNLTVLDD
jgi:hypothetical protein